MHSESITDDARRFVIDQPKMAGVRVTLPLPRPAPPTCTNYKMPSKTYNTEACKHSEGKRLSGPTDPDLQPLRVGQDEHWNTNNYHAGHVTYTNQMYSWYRKLLIIFAGGTPLHFKEFL